MCLRHTGQSSPSSFQVTLVRVALQTSCLLGLLVHLGPAIPVAVLQTVAVPVVQRVHAQTPAADPLPEAAALLADLQALCLVHVAGEQIHVQERIRSRLVLPVFVL